MFPCSCRLSLPFNSQGTRAAEPAVTIAAVVLLRSQTTNTARTASGDAAESTAALRIVTFLIALWRPHRFGCAITVVEPCPWLRNGV